MQIIHKAAARIAILFAVYGASLLGFSSAAVAQTAAQPSIDLKLFEKSEVDRSKGCSVVLWQADRDPDTDKFAYLFMERLSGKNHTRQPARMKIAGQIVTMTRVATGGKNNGYNLFEYQLYKLPEADEFVVLELKLAPLEGESVEIDDGTMSVIMKGKQIFRASVKGNAGCNTPAASEPPPSGSEKKNAVDSTSPGQFERYTVRSQHVPRSLVQMAIKRFGCEVAVLKGAVLGFQMSEESAIWQIPCGDYGTQKSAVFALVYLTDPAKEFSFLPFKWSKGQNRNLGDYAMMAPHWDIKARTVTSTYTEGNGKDCGSVERHRVTAEGSFELVELRAREACDGKAIGSENFPIVFKAK